MILKKSWLIGCNMILVLTSALFAAGTQESADEPRKNVTLTIAASQNWIKDIDREIAEDFTNETGIKIDYQVNPDNQYPQILQTKINTGEAPDVFYYPSGLSLKQLPLSKVLDLSSEPWAGRMKNWAVNGATIDDRLVALNIWAVDGWAFVYNTAIFDNLGLVTPNNFEELLAVCEVIAANGITPIYEIVGDLWHAPLYLNQAIAEASVGDSDLYNKLNTNQIALSEIDSLKNSLDQLSILADKGYLGETYMSNTWTNATEAMGTGAYAMFLGYTSWQNEVVNDYPEANAENWKMFASPLGADGEVKSFGTSSGGIVALISDGPNAEEAKMFFEYRTRPEVLKKFYAERPDLSSNPSFPEVPASPTKGLESIIEHVDGNFMLDAQGGVLYFELMAYGSEIQALLSGAITSSEALANMDKYRRNIGKSAGQEGF